MPTHPFNLLLALIPLAYLLGSIPFGLIVGRLKGVDVTTLGSKNIGATNVGRVLGKRYFYLVTALDAGKSLLPLAAASWLVHSMPPDQRGWVIYATWLAVGAAALLGHLFSVFLGFKGGKGVATGAGLVLGLWPYFTLPGLLVIGLFVLLVALFRYISLGSITAAAAFPLVYLLIGVLLDWPVFDSQLPLLVVATLLAVAVIVRHRANINRLLAGTESRF